jgi:hypothetical protein
VFNPPGIGLHEFKEEGVRGIVASVLKSFNRLSKSQLKFIETESKHCPKEFACAAVLPVDSFGLAQAEKQALFGNRQSVELTKSGAQF